MGFSLSTQFLLFLWFSGVNHFVNPSSETGSGMDPDYQQADMMPLEDQHFNLPQRYRQAFPPYHSDPIQEPLRRHYRLEDFLWTGSGDGPHPSEQDGGLAWEDNGGSPQSADKSRSWIRVTKTMTLYRTVLTTIYPVEMTPTVISDHPPQVQPTPHLSEYFSDSMQSLFIVSSFSSPDVLTGPTDSQMWLPTPTFTPNPPEPTQILTSPPTSPPELPPSPLPTHSLEDDELKEMENATSVLHQQDNYTAASTDLMYWIQTSIKANDTAFKDASRVFQSKMQKRLARVYASAFKRHLMSNLGVLPPPHPPQKNLDRRRRKRRQSNNGFDDSEIEYYPDQLHRWLYVAQSSMSPTQLRNLATAAMNVTVTILNISAEKEPQPTRVDLQYIVLAEGTPVPAFSAVKELDLVTKEEMEQEIGYEIINKKAEALVAGPPEQMTRNEQIASTSPWLIVAITTICLLVILLALIAFMVWKWKHNRLGDSNARRVPPAPRPQSGILEIEEGVINPAFLGTPSRIGQEESPEKSERSSPALSLLSARARSARKKLSAVLNMQNSRLGSASKGKDKKDFEDDDEEVERNGRRGRSRYKGQTSPTSSEELRLHKRRSQLQQQQHTSTTITSSEGSGEWKELLGEPKPKGGARARQRSPARAKTSTPTFAKMETRKDAKDVLRKKRKKISKIEEASLKTDEEEEVSDISPSSGETEGPDSPRPDDHQAWPRGSTDAISLGNLDVCQDTIAQTPSEYARKLVPWKRPGSASALASGSKTSQYHAGTSVGDGYGGGRRPGSRMALPETIEEIPSYDLTEEEEGSKELDRDLSEKSFEMKESPRKFGRKSASPLAPDMKDAKVQTPTRISKIASHKSRAAPKPRKSWRGSSSGRPPSESVISTESEEIVEVHHINSSMSDEQNPLGRMRKRFHQFLDDAFNVMVSGTKKDESNGRGETQSAKVSISHEVVEKETEARPWTSHVIREETLQKLRRPKSAAIPIGPPKRAWTASSERRTNSAKSKACSETKSGAVSRIPSATDIQAVRSTPFQQIEDDEEEVFDKMSIPCLKTINRGGNPPGATGGIASHSASERSQSHSSSMVLSPAFIFPQYPAYPDIRVATGTGGASSTNISSSSRQQTQSSPLPPPSLAIDDPAVPVIRAIQHEMKRFEKDSSSPSSSKQFK